ncbi:MAG TPA: phosphatidylinositol mannoside acyltransferase [Mycobacteriales bacterium]|nr:phosphatidylinositol mannoside acyltransferase [Mycobacteriales bacterium]HWA66009.1 phosphatidylinositol mannoside acyltransferase [Mycobacteriales bacterium]
MNENLADVVYAAGWAVMRGMPERLARRQFDAIADAYWVRSGSGVITLHDNLARVVPDASDRELRLLTRDGVRSYMRYWCEVFQLPSMRKDDLIARTHCVDEQRLRDAVAAGKGMILALPHMGNWDQAGAWLAGTGVPFTTVAERIRPESLFNRFVTFRESLGMEVVPLTGGERAPFELLAERLRAGGTLCLLADRDLTATGIEVDFFGSGARMPAGPAALAHDTGAALLPVTLTFPDRRHWRTRIHEQIVVPDEGDREAKIRAMTQQMADAFAEAIRTDPQDWHMLQRVWVDDLDTSRLSDNLSV